MEAFAARLQVLDSDPDAAAHAGEIRAQLERQGRSIGSYDLLIADHACSRGLVVVTGNLAEFRLAEGLECEDGEIQIAVHADVAILRLASILEITFDENDLAEVLDQHPSIFEADLSCKAWLQFAS